MLLEVKDVSIQFGGLKVIEKMSLKVEKGELIGLIGPNGAGKTTAFNMISGIYTPTAGDIYFDGTRINGIKAFEIAKRGVIRTFQNIRLFPNLSVAENIEVSMHMRCPYSLPAAFLNGPKFHRVEAEFREARSQALKNFRLASIWSTLRRVHCPTEFSVKLKSCGPWPVSRNCCCSMNPRRG